MVRLQLVQGWHVETAAGGMTIESVVQFVLTELISKDKIQSSEADLIIPPSVFK